VAAVIKMRHSDHSRAIHRYEVSSSGIHLKEPLTQFRGILTGVPTRLEDAPRTPTPGLTLEEELVMQALLKAGELDADALAASLKLDVARTGAALERLAALRYAVAVDQDGRVLYRPVGRTLGG
jgi:hypothetical protein